MFRTIRHDLEPSPEEDPSCSQLDQWNSAVRDRKQKWYAANFDKEMRRGGGGLPDFPPQPNISHLIQINPDSGNRIQRLLRGRLQNLPDNLISDLLCRYLSSVRVEREQQ